MGVSFNSHPACSDPFLKFLKSDDPRYRLGFNHPRVQDAEACCLFGSSPDEAPDICEAKLDAVWRDPMIQERWYQAQASVKFEILKIQKLVQQFGEKPQLLSPPDVELQEAGAGEALAKTALLGALAVSAFVLVWGNIAHNNQETNRWFRDTSRPFPETGTSRPPVPIPIDVEDFDRAPHPTPKDEPKPLDRLPPPPIDWPRRRRLNCDQSQALALTNVDGRFIGNIKTQFNEYQNGGSNEFADQFRGVREEERYFHPRPTLYWAWSPSENKRVPVYIRQLPFNVVYPLLSEGDKKDTWLDQVEVVAANMVIMVAETADCEFLGTSLGVLEVHNPKDIKPYTTFAAIRYWKFPDSSIQLKNLSLIYYLSTLLSMNRLGYNEDPIPNRVSVEAIRLDLLQSMRKHTGTDGYLYRQTRIRGYRERINLEDVSVMEALHTLRMLPDGRLPKD